VQQRGSLLAAAGMASPMGPPAPRPSTPRMHPSSDLEDSGAGPGQATGLGAGEDPGAEQQPDVLDQPCVFQCGSCKSILGDTTSLVAAVEEAGVLALSTATGVTVTEELRLSRAGLESGCTFHSLQCRGCKARVGCVYRTTVPALDLARGLFSLQRKAVTSYQLGSGMTATDEGTGATSMPQLVDAVHEHEARLEDLEAAVRALGEQVSVLEQTGHDAAETAAAAAAAVSAMRGQASSSPAQASPGARQATRKRQRADASPAQGGGQAGRTGGGGGRAAATTTPSPKPRGKRSPRRQSLSASVSPPKRARPAAPASPAAGADRSRATASPSLMQLASAAKSSPE